MPDNTTTPTPVTPSVTAATTPPPQLQRAPQAPPATPVTSQPTPPTAPSQPQKPSLDTVQAAETFTALNKLFDEQTPTPPPPVDTKPSDSPAKPSDEPAKPIPVGADDFQKKLDESQAPSNAHPNVSKGLEAVKTLAKTEHDRAEDLNKQLAEARTQLETFTKEKAEGKLPEPIAKELEDLRAMRREIDFRNDPEFQNQYIKPVDQAEKEITGLLIAAGLKEEHLKWIQDNGGLITLAQSGENAGIKDKPDMTMAEWVENFVLAKTPSIFRNRIQGKLANAMELIEKGRSELSDFQQNSKQRYEAKMQKLTEEFNSSRDAAINALGDLAKPKVIPATATAQERAEIETHNTRLKEAAQKYENYMKTSNDPRVAAEILVKATQAEMLLTMYQQAEARNKALTEKIEGMKAAGSHSTAGDHTAAPGPEKPTMGDLLKTPTETAMNALFNKQQVTP